MRFLRFLARELLLHGVVFAVVGTIVLSILYLLSIGAPSEAYLEAAQSFLLFISGNTNTKVIGFSSGQIIASGAAVTLPLAVISLIFIILISLICSSFAVSSRYMAVNFGKHTGEKFDAVWNLIASVFAAIPLFVGFWVYYVVIGDGISFPLITFALIAFVTVAFGGLAWDATNFLKTDMLAQVGQTHAIVYSTLGQKMGSFFPSKGSYTGYLFSSSLPRFIPYLAGKVPAIIGSVTIAEIALNFPGLGKNLIDALIETKTDLLVTSVFVLLCINAIVSLLVKTVLFLIYPRVYEKAI